MKNHKPQGFEPSYTISAHIEAHSETHSRRTVGAQSAHSAPLPDDKEGRFSAKELAETLGIGSATLRTRWYPWLREAVTESRLKVGGKFTELAKTLFQSYASDVVARELPPNEHGDAARAWAERKSGEFAPSARAEVTTDEPKTSALAIPEFRGELNQHQASRLETQSNCIDDLAEYLEAIKAKLEAESAAAAEEQEQRQELTAEEQELLTEVEILNYRRQRRAHYELLRQIDEEEKARILGKPQIGDGVV